MDTVEGYYCDQCSIDKINEGNKKIIKSFVQTVKEKKASFLVNEEELELLKKVTILEPSLEDVMNSAKRVKDQYRVKFLVEDLKEALEALSYAAGCMVSYPENEKMYKLHEKIEAFIILHQVLKNSQP